MNILITVAASFGAGAVLIYVASALPSGRKISSELWALYRFEFAIVGFFLVPAAASKWAFLLFLLAVECRGVFELFELLGARSDTTMLWLSAITGCALVGFAIVAPEHLLAGYALAIAVNLLVGSAVERGRVSMRTVLAVFSLSFPTLLVMLAGLVRNHPNGFVWIFLVYASVEMNDAFALLFGRLAGRHRILPRLSPRKTTEGLLGGFLIGGTTGYYIASRLLGFSTGLALLIVGLILIAGLAGDLICSALKRWQNRKDFSPVAAAHGGVLDIYDSLLFAAPLALLVRAVFGA